MKPEDVFDSTPPSPEPLTEDEIKLWPQARGELLAYANHLAGRGITITAAQMRLAVKLADRQVAGMTPRWPKEEPSGPATG